MEISLREEKGFAVVGISGRMDAVTAPEFEKQSAQWIAEKKTRIVLDLSGLEYISSAGLRSILALAKKAKPAGGGVALAGLTGIVQEVFSVSGFDAFLPIAPDVESAMASL